MGLYNLCCSAEAKDEDCVSNFIQNTCREVRGGLCNYQVRIAYICEVRSLDFLLYQFIMNFIGPG